MDAVMSFMWGITALALTGLRGNVSGGGGVVPPPPMPQRHAFTTGFSLGFDA